MSVSIRFPVQSERYGVRIHVDDGFEAILAFPVEVAHLGGAKEKVRYDFSRERNGDSLCTARIRAHNGNEYDLTDLWHVDGNLVTLNRRFACTHAITPAEVRLSSDFDCFDGRAASFGDYQFVIPGALYNRNDGDGDGIDDYLGTFAQDYRDDRNPGLYAVCYSPSAVGFMALLRADPPVRDKTLTREQIRARHFVHDTDVGSLGVAPSCHRAGGVSMHLDFPFYERNSFCLNADGSEWAAYRRMEAGDSFEIRYGLFFGRAASLTEAAWCVSQLQMDRLLEDSVPLPFTLEEARKNRHELIFHSFREFPDKADHPAGFFMHFSPRERYGRQNILEYGFSGAQTLNCYVMLRAARQGSGEESRKMALKTLDFFVRHCIEPSGLPNGIYDVDREEFVYWWTGILFPFQYSNDRAQLEAYLGDQIVSALAAVATELGKVKGNYVRTMVEAMHYLLLSYIEEREAGFEHPGWFRAVEGFCDRLIALQNVNGSWNRGYSMVGVPLTNPPEWFGRSESEIGSGALFPSEVLVTFYNLTREQKYLDAARRASRFILKNYVSNVKYVGGLNDTTHIKSVKIDSVGVMFAMRSLLMVYEATGEAEFLQGARDAARILATWTFIWDVPFDETTLLGARGFKTTGWAGCDVIPAGSYVDNEFQEFVPDLLRIAEFLKDRHLAMLAKVVSRGMQHGLSMPGRTYGYPLMGVQCEGYLTSLWLSDTADRVFSGAAAKNKGDDNDTCNGLVNAQALYNIDRVEERYKTLDYDEILRTVLHDQRSCQHQEIWQT